MLYATRFEVTVQFGGETLVSMDHELSMPEKIAHMQHITLFDGLLPVQPKDVIWDIEARAVWRVIIDVDAESVSHAAEIARAGLGAGWSVSDLPE